MDKISHSEVEAHLLCERKDYYGSALGLERKKVSQSLSRGIAMHDILAYFFTHLQKNPADYAGAGQAARSRAQELVTLNPELMVVGDEIMKMLNSFLRTRWWEGYKVVYVEEKMALVVDESLMYPFTVDLVLEDSGGNWIVVDHKTTYDFFSPMRVSLSGQLPKYMGAMRVLGHRADFAMYHQLRYRTKKDYTDADVIQISKFTPSVKRIQTSFTEQVDVARRLQRLRKLPIEEQNRLAVRTANHMVCNSCSFQDLCVADLNGEPLDLIIEANYQPRTDRYEEIEE